MALMSLRKFAKFSGITAPAIRKLIDSEVITRDKDSGLIDSGEILKIYRDKLRGAVKHYTIILWFNKYGNSGEEDIKRIMDKEDAVEVSCFDDICVLFNQSLQEKTLEMSGLINKKYKEKVLVEFAKRYKASILLQLTKLTKDVNLRKFSYAELCQLLLSGKFPNGYEYLEKADIKDYVKVSTERSLILTNNYMTERFHKICEDLLLYWADSDHELVFNRSDIDDEFYEDIRRSQLRRDILSSPRAFLTGSDTEHTTEIFEDLKAGIKFSFISGVLTEYAKKRFYRVVKVGSSLGSEDSFKLLDDLRISNCNEVIVCSSIESANKYLPEAVRFYLISMQHEQKDSVIYIGDLTSNKIVMNEYSEIASVVEKESDSVVVNKPASEAKSSSEKQESVSEEEVSNEKHESGSGVETSPEPAEPVSAQPEVEVIPASSVEIVSKEEDARDSIKGLLSSLG